LLRYAQESSRREDNRRVSNGDKVSRVAALVKKRGKSVDFTGYWQRHVTSQFVSPTKCRAFCLLESIDAA
jgi:hypothetical protein